MGLKFELVMKIKDKMHALKISSYGLAQLTGLNPTTVRRFLNHQASPSIDNIEKITRALGIRVTITGSPRN